VAAELATTSKLATTSDPISTSSSVTELSTHAFAAGLHLDPHLRLAFLDGNDLFRVQDALQIRRGVPQLPRLSPLAPVFLQHVPYGRHLIVRQSESLGEVTEDDRVIGFTCVRRGALVQGIRRRAVTRDCESRE
jgi:hypothetical protein